MLQDIFAGQGRAIAAALLVVSVLVAPGSVPAWADGPDHWAVTWPDTDFSRHAVPFDEIISGGVPKDGIPAIDEPEFAPARDVAHLYKGREPVIALAIDGAARAYPLGILMTHEIVNDTLAGVPVAVTYCPLCNSAIAFDRRAGGRVLDFGVTGKLRHSDLVMYDRQSESWWQQFTGEAIVGEMTGTALAMLPVRVESFERFRERHPEGQVLLNPRGGPGHNPYRGYDSAERPFLYKGSFPEGIAPLAYVVAVGEEAWSLDLLRREKRIETADGLVITWRRGQNSALDRNDIATGRDIGNVVVQREGPEGARDEVYEVTFAFAFHAFHPDGTIHK